MIEESFEDKYSEIALAIESIKEGVESEVEYYVEQARPKRIYLANHVDGNIMVCCDGEDLDFNTSDLLENMIDIFIDGIFNENEGFYKNGTTEQSAVANKAITSFRAAADKIEKRLAEASGDA